MVLPPPCPLTPIRTNPRRIQFHIGWTDTVARRPSSARAHGHLGAALLRANRPEESAVASAEVRRLFPLFPDARVNLGKERLGRNAEAVPHFEAALGDDPNHPKAHYNLGNALAHCAEYESCEVSENLTN